MYKCLYFERQKWSNIGGKYNIERSNGDFQNSRDFKLRRKHGGGLSLAICCRTRMINRENNSNLYCIWAEFIPIIIWRNWDGQIWPRNRALVVFSFRSIRCGNNVIEWHKGNGANTGLHWRSM